MTDYSIQLYTSALQNDWNQFIRSSKNGTFLFDRRFMDYHSDRFTDYSLLIYRKSKLVAVLPAHRIGDELFAHKGLTYGELIVSKTLKFNRIAAIFQQILQHLDQQGITHLTLKLIPHIYHAYPAEESLYILHYLKAECIHCDLSSSIDLAHKLKLQSNRLEGVKKAQKHDLTIRKDKNLAAFWHTILIPNLQRQHQAHPVHSAEEIQLLADRFPKNIVQYNVYQGEKLVGGTTLFITDKVVHTQYISANEQRQELGTLDYLFQHLITLFSTEKAYFDFGTSSTSQGLNSGLLYWKNCFGARGIVSSTYKLTVKNHYLLDELSA